MAPNESNTGGECSPEKSSSVQRSQRSPEQIEQLLTRRADRYRKEKKQQLKQTIDLVMFRRAEDRYGVQLDQLEEIRKSPEIRPVPGVSAVIAGVINVRGQIVAVHDLAAFRGQSHTLQRESWVMVGHGPGVLMGLVADEVPGVRSVPIDRIRPVPLSLESPHQEFRGVVDETAMVLDFEGLAENPQFFVA